MARPDEAGVGLRRLRARAVAAGAGNGTTGAWNPASTLYTVQLTR
jgi:hypothetical protein